MPKHDDDKYAGARIEDKIGPFDISVFFLNAHIKSQFIKNFSDKYIECYEDNGITRILDELRSLKEYLSSSSEYVEEVKRVSGFSNASIFATKRKEQLALYLDRVIEIIEEYDDSDPLRNALYVSSNFYFFAKRGEDIKVTWLPDQDVLLSQSINEREITVYPTLAKEILAHEEDNIVLDKIKEWNDADYREDLMDAPIGHTQKIADKDEHSGIYHDIFFGEKDDEERGRSRLSDLVHFNRGVFQTPVLCNGEEVGFLFICSPVDFEKLFDNEDECRGFFEDVTKKTLEKGIDTICARIKNKYEESVSLVEGHHIDDKINSAVEAFREIIYKSEKNGASVHQFLKMEESERIIHDWLGIESIDTKSRTALFLYKGEPYDEKYKKPANARRLRRDIMTDVLNSIGLHDINMHVSDNIIYVPVTPFLPFFLSLKNFIYSLTSEGRPPPERLDFHHTTCNRTGHKNLEKYYLEIKLKTLTSTSDEENGLPYVYNKYKKEHKTSSSASEQSNVSRSLHKMLYCALGSNYFTPKDTDKHLQFLADGFSRQVLNVSFLSKRSLVLSWEVSP